MSLEDLHTLVEIGANIITTAGIVVAGVWSYYTFVRSRAFAPNVKIDFKLRGVVNLEQAKGVIVGVVIENIGKTKVRKKTCVTKAQAIVEPKAMVASTEFRRVDRQSMRFDTARVYPIIENHDFLEPAEHVQEDVLFFLGESPIFKVGVEFRDRKNNRWSSSAIMDICESQDD